MASSLVVLGPCLEHLKSDDGGGGCRAGTLDGWVRIHELVGKQVEDSTSLSSGELLLRRRQVKLRDEAVDHLCHIVGFVADQSLQFFW